MQPDIHEETPTKENCIFQKRPSQETYVHGKRPTKVMYGRQSMVGSPSAGQGLKKHDEEGRKIGTPIENKKKCK